MDLAVRFHELKFIAQQIRETDAVVLHDQVNRSAYVALFRLRARGILVLAGGIASGGMAFSALNFLAKSRNSSASRLS